MLGLSVIVASAIARAIERSPLGYGFAAIRDDEVAAEASGVPTLRLKLIATTLSGGFMGMAGAPLPYYVTYLDPASGFSLSYAVNTIAMPLIGGTSSWLGPVIGAVLLGTLQQVATVTISSALSLLIVGVLLVVLRGRRAERHRRPGSSRCSDDRAAARSPAWASASAASSRWPTSNSTWRDGERLGLIGPNGSGKSTLVNCLCGTLRNETGSVRFAGHALDGLSAHQRTRLGLARSFQLPRPFGTLTLAENLRVPILYAVDTRRGGVRTADDRRSAAATCWTWSAWPTRPTGCRAT